MDRRKFLKRSAVLTTGLAGLPTRAAEAKKSSFKISLAEWSQNRALFGRKLDHLDFPRVAREEYGIAAVELVNQFFMDKARDTRYLAEFKRRAQDHGFARAVSAKSIDFDAQGNCVETDYRKMMKIVLAAGYHGHVGVEYSGDKLSEPDGIRATKKLLEKIRDEPA